MSPYNVGLDPSGGLAEEIKALPFAYYRRLTKSQKRIYDRSDGIGALRLPASTRLRPLVHHLHSALQAADRIEVTRTTRALTDALCKNFDVAPVKVTVRARRPSDDWGELHGLYTPARGRAMAAIEVWMRTAQRQQVVAFRTYLRTVLHEINHHLDIEFFGLEDSLHTEGFYKRESSLFKQLVRGTGL